MSRQTPTFLLKGLGASPGRARGKVCLIKDPSQFSKFFPGAILVTVMTNPFFTPLMEKAAGIITDEGGTLCHAAIVARELGIPCVVGTRKATKVLADNDLVEMDGKDGWVKLLKKD